MAEGTHIYGIGQNTSEEVAEQAAGWAGSLALGAKFAVIGTAGGGPVGGVVGGLLGGAVGYFIGSATAMTIIEAAKSPPDVFAMVGKY